MNFLTLKTNLAVEFLHHDRFLSNLKLNGSKMAILTNFMNLLGELNLEIFLPNASCNLYLSSPFSTAAELFFSLRKVKIMYRGLMNRYKSTVPSLCPEQFLISKFSPQQKIEIKTSIFEHCLLLFEI